MNGKWYVSDACKYYLISTCVEDLCNFENKEVYSKCTISTWVELWGCSLIDQVYINDRISTYVEAKRIARFLCL